MLLSLLRRQSILYRTDRRNSSRSIHHEVHLVGSGIDCLCSLFSYDSINTKNGTLFIQPNVN